MPNYKNHIIADKSVIVIFDNGSMKSVSDSNSMFTQIVDKLKAREFEGIDDIMDVATKIKRHKSGLFDVVGDQILLDKEILPASLSDRVLAMADAGLDFTPLINFWNNIKLNPSQESKNDLYAFLEHNGIPLTRDGFFIAYKRVDENFKDAHTHSMDNSIGATVSMPRSEVNHDRTVTCSRGLHCANYEYASKFYPNGILVEVMVNPKDVVSVPVDYDQAKMRCCEYKIIRRCEGPRPEQELVYDQNVIDAVDDREQAIEELAELLGMTIDDVSNRLSKYYKEHGV